MSSSHFTKHHMPLGVGRGQNIGLRYFCHKSIATLLPPGNFTCYFPIQSRHVNAMKHKTSILVIVYLFCSFVLFVLNFYFVLIFELFNLLLILFIYFIYLFIIFFFASPIFSEH